MTCPPVTIRPADNGDLAAVVELFWQCWTRTYTGALAGRMDRRRAGELWAAALEDVGTQMLVATGPDGEVRGVVRFWVEDAVEGHVASLYVAPEAHGRGLGRALLARAQQDLRSAGARRATLFVFAENTAARAFYQRLGWWASGRERVEQAFGEPELELAIDLTTPPKETPWASHPDGARSAGSAPSPWPQEGSAPRFRPTP